MHRTTTATPHELRTAPEAPAERGSDAYEAWMDRLIAEAPEFGPQTTRELQAAFAPYLPADVQLTEPAVETEFPLAA